MKKSQVLAALALAFALGLGVVVPATATYAAPVARVTTNTTSATNDNLKSAVNYVTSNATYKAFAAYTEAKEAADNMATDGIKTIADAATAVTTSLNAYKAQVVSSTDPVAALTTNKNTLKTTISTNYNKYAALYEAFNAEADKIGSTAAIKGITDAMNALGLGNSITVEEDDTFTDVKNAAEGVINNDADSKKAYDATVAVKGAEETLEVFNNLKNALLSAELGLTKAQIKTVNKATTVAALVAIAPADAANWSAVVEKINDIKDAIKDENGKTNAERYGLLNNTTAGQEGLLQLMQTATDNDDLTYAQLISAAPVNPDGTGDGTNKPDDNTDDEKDPSAPDTGILSNTEASASTTLAMVAGIATALTAAGAGVVAYRNARRSSRK